MAALFGVLILTTSCNDEWKEEQYTQYISFKAPLDTEGNSVGVTTVHVPYTRIDESGNPRYGATGVSSYELPVIVSGSTHNNRNLTVHIAHDPDTLDILNYERFNYRKELYYNDMNTYATYSPTLDIRKGDDITLFHIGLDFRGIDLAEKWVLPLTIEDKDANGNSYGYERNPRKNYAKAMLRILPYTDYSGQYIATNLKFFNLVSGKNLEMGPLVIIELKRDGLCYSPVLEMLRQLHIHPHGFSKYCMGSALTNPALPVNRFKPKLRDVDRILRYSL